MSFDIPLDEIGDGVTPGEDTVTIAARAVVEGDSADGTHPRCLLGDKCVAWGKGPRFRPRLPAMYFTYDVQETFDCLTAGGVEVGGACWFLRASGASCTATCGDEGAVYDEATRSYAGDQGTLENCEGVLTELGLPSAPLSQRTSPLGCGCLAFDDCATTLRYFRDIIDTTADASSSNSRRACACAAPGSP